MLEVYNTNVWGPNHILPTSNTEPLLYRVGRATLYMYGYALFLRCMLLLGT